MRHRRNSPFLLLLLVSTIVPIAIPLGAQPSSPAPAQGEAALRATDLIFERWFNKGS